MCDVDALRPELAGQGLDERACGELADREGGEVRGCFEGGRRAREDQCRWVLGVVICGLEEKG